MEKVQRKEKAPDCHCDAENGDPIATVRSVNKCKHSFCEECAIRWFKNMGVNSCPTCRGGAVSLIIETYENTRK